MDLTHFQPWYISVLIYIYYYIDSIQRIYRFRDYLEESGDFGVFWSLFSVELHRRVRCLAMYGDLPTVRLTSSSCTRYSFELAFQCRQFEVNQHPVAEVIPVLLKNGQFASREEVVEEMNDCRSMTQHWCQSTMIPERGPSVFQDRLKPRSHTKLPK